MPVPVELSATSAKSTRAQWEIRVHQATTVLQVLRVFQAQPVQMVVQDDQVLWVPKASKVHQVSWVQPVWTDSMVEMVFQV